MTQKKRKNNFELYTLCLECHSIADIKMHFKQKSRVKLNYTYRFLNEQSLLILKEKLILNLLSFGLKRLEF